MLALHLFTMPAEAVNRYVNGNPAIGSDTYNGLSPTFVSGTTGPWRTTSWANANVAAADNVFVASRGDTTYDAPIRPVAPNTSWFGDSVSKNVRVPGLTLESHATLINGFRAVGSLGISSSGQYAHVRNTDVVGSTTISRKAVRIENCRLGTGQATSTLRIDGPTGQTDSLKLINNGIHLKQVGDLTWNGQHLLDFQSVSTTATTMKDWIVSGNRCTLEITNGQNWEKTAFIYGLQRALFEGNSWLVLDGCGRNNGDWFRADGTKTVDNQAFVVRDGVTDCIFRNETIELRSASPDGSGRAHAYIYSSGTQIACRRNLWDGCLWKSNIQNGSAAFINEWRMGTRDRITRTAVICSTNAPALRIEGAEDSAFVDRNTIVNLGSGPAFSIGADEAGAGAWGSAGRIRVSGNVVYTRGSSGAGRYEYLPTFASGLLYSDYNLFFAKAKGKTGALWKRNYGEYPGLFIVPGAPNAGGYELASKYGHPMFLDSLYASFNATPTAGTAVRGVGPSGVDCGAIDYVPPPDKIVNLQSLGGTSNTVSLGWTVPAGGATTYDVRYSTTPITEANFTSATPAAGEPTPGAAGSWETMTVTGLASSTHYFFAMRSSNAVSASFTSNLAMERTWPSNAIEP